MSLSGNSPRQNTLSSTPERGIASSGIDRQYRWDRGVQTIIGEIGLYGYPLPKKFYQDQHLDFEP